MSKFVAYNSVGSIIGFYDSNYSPVPDGITAIPISDDDWQASGVNTSEWSVVDGVLTPPTSQVVLSNAQTFQIGMMYRACDFSIVSGFTSSALGTSNQYGSAQTDQMNLNDATTISISPNTPSNWSTDLWCSESGTWTFTAHSAAQVQQVHLDFVSFRLSQQTQLQSRKQQILAASTVSDVQSITWTSN